MANVICFHRMIRKTIVALSFLVGVLMELPFAGAADTSEPGKKALPGGDINDGMRESAIQRLQSRGIEPAQFDSKLLEALGGKTTADVALAGDLILGGANVFAHAKETEELRARVKLASANAELLELFRRDVEADEKMLAEAVATAEKELQAAERAYRKCEDMLAQMEQDAQGARDAEQREVERARARDEMARLGAALEQARHKNTVYSRYWQDARVGKMLLGSPQGDAAVKAQIVRAREAALAYIKALKEYPEAADKAAARDKINALNSARVKAEELALNTVCAERVLTGKSYAVHYESETVEFPDGTTGGVNVPLSPRQAEETRIVEKVYKGVDAGFFSKDVDLTSSEQVIQALRGLGVIFPKGCSASYNPKKRTLKVVTRGDLHKDVEKVLDMYKRSKPSLENQPGLSLTSGKLRSDAKLYVLFLISKESITAHKSLDKEDKDKVKKELARISKHLRPLQKRGDVQFVWVVEEGANKTELKKLLMDPLRIKGAYMTYKSDSRYIDGNYGCPENYGIASLDEELEWFSNAFLMESGCVLDAIDEWVKKNPVSK